MMDDEKVRVYFDGSVYCAPGKIHGSRHALHWATMIQLQAVQRCRIVRDSSHVQQVVEMRGYLEGGGHVYLVAGNGTPGGTVTVPAMIPC